MTIQLPDNFMTLRRLLLILLLTAVFHPVHMQDDPEPDARVIQMENRLRVREIPNQKSAVLTSLEPAAPLTVLGKSSGGVWLQVATPEGIIGWVSIDYVEVLIDLDTVRVTYDQGLVSQGNKLPPGVEKNVRRIFQRGQELGNRPDVFSKIGDSITAAPHMYTPIGEGKYFLAEYEYLQGVIDYYTRTDAREGNSFINPSLAAGVGWTTSVMYDADFADKTLCEEDETPLQCEYRLVKPSVALVMLGTNDVSFNTLDIYRNNIAGIVDYLVDNGVIPILSTIPPREGYEDRVLEFNAAVREVAQDFAIPLWDYHAVMTSLANNGLDADGVHPSVPAKGVDGAADFRKQNRFSGYVMRNLTALQMLNAVWRVITTDTP
jgi:hypothetical protein